MLAVALQMATAATQGAKNRTPKGFQKVLAVNMGFGVDQHGQDATVRTIANLQKLFHLVCCIM